MVQAFTPGKSTKPEVFFAVNPKNPTDEDLRIFRAVNEVLDVMKNQPVYGGDVAANKILNDDLKTPIAGSDLKKAVYKYIAESVGVYPRFTGIIAGENRMRNRLVDPVFPQIISRAKGVNPALPVLQGKGAPFRPDRWKKPKR
jgi:hypothetical protein